MDVIIINTVIIIIISHLYMRTFTLDQQRKNRKTVYNEGRAKCWKFQVANNVQVIRNTAHRPSTPASYTASRVQLNKENQPWRRKLQPDSQYHQPSFNEGI